MRTARRWEQTQGFTWPELLVVVVIVLILAAIALPSFKACAHKDSEAKQYVGVLVRSQQAFYIENNRFAKSIKELNPSVPANTKFYEYSVEPGNTKTVVYGQSYHSNLKSYVGAAFIKPNTKSESEGIVCEAIEAGKHQLAAPIDAKTCGEGSRIPRGKC
jgi:type IV pilus assembly protein PilA